MKQSMEIKQELNKLPQRYNIVHQNASLLINYANILSQNPGLQQNKAYLIQVQAKTVSQSKHGIKQMLIQYLLENYQETESLYQKFSILKVIQTLQQHGEQWLMDTLNIRSLFDLQKLVVTNFCSFDKLSLDDNDSVVNFLIHAQNLFKINISLNKFKPTATSLQQLMHLINSHICIFNTRPTEGNFVCMYNNALGTFTLPDVGQQMISINRKDVFSIVNLTTFSNCKKDTINNYPPRINHVVYFGSFFQKNTIHIEYPQYLTIASLFNCQYISLSNCYYLKKIILQYVTTVDIQDFQTMIYLEHLYINTCGNVHRQPEESIITAISNCQRIQTIEIYNFWLPQIQIIDFPLPKLNVLVLYGIGMNTLKVFTTQAQMKHLQLLIIGNTEISNDMEARFEFYGPFNFEQLYFVNCKNKEHIQQLISQ